MFIFGSRKPALDKTGSSTKTRCWILSYAFKIVVFSGLVREPCGDFNHSSFTSVYISLLFIALVCWCVANAHLHALYHSSIDKVVPFSAAVPGVAPVRSVQLVELLLLFVVVLHCIPGSQDRVPLHGAFFFKSALTQSIKKV